MHSIRIDLRRIVRAGGKLPLVILLIAITALVWAAFGPIPDKPGQGIAISEGKAADVPKRVTALVGGIVTGDWNCNGGTNEWVPYEDKASAMGAMANGMVDYLIACNSNESVKLFAENADMETLLSTGVMHVGESDRPLRITEWLRNESGPDKGAFLAAVWAALAMLMVIPVRIAAFLVFQERSSGRLEWVLANQMSVRRYACNKSAASTVGAVGLLALIWGCLFALGIAFMKFALLNSAAGATMYEQGQVFMGEVFARGSAALISAGVNLAAVSFAVSVLAVRLFLGSRFQLRVTTLIEVCVLFAAFLPLVLPEAPQWVPLFGALSALESSMAGGAIAWMSMLISVGISVALGLVALTGLRPGRMFSK